MVEIGRRFQMGGVASLLTLVAGISLLLMTRADVIAFAPQKPLYLVTACILLVAAIGPFVHEAEPWFQMLLWNGTGWCVGLAVLGLESVGSLPLWPIMLAALALTFWPRRDENLLAPSAIAIAFIGGFLVCWLGWSDPDIPPIDTWMEGL